jgi:hypothetical protein
MYVVILLLTVYPLVTFSYDTPKPEHQQSLYSPPTVLGAAWARYCDPDAVKLSMVKPPYNLLPVIRVNSGETILPPQVSITIILSRSVKLMPVSASKRHVWPIAHVLSWVNGEGPTIVRSPRSTRKESVKEHDHSVAHQHNLYCPPAAVVATSCKLKFVILTDPPLSTTIGSSPMWGLRGIVLMPPQVFKIL